MTVAPPPQVDPHSAAEWWANLTGILTASRGRRALYGAPHVAWQYTWTGRQLTISVWVPGTVAPGAVEAAVRAAWPGAACSSGPAGPPVSTEPGRARAWLSLVTIAASALLPRGDHLIGTAHR